MWNRVAVALAAASLLFVRGALASGQDRAVTPVYTNVEIVSIDSVTRLAVVKNSKGAEETLEFDDSLAGTPGVKAGDRVMLTVRGEPGRRRISAIGGMT